MPALSHHPNNSARQNNCAGCGGNNERPDGCVAPPPRVGRIDRSIGALAAPAILRDRRRQPAGELSDGRQQMVAIGRALMARPRIVLFDEPSLGLAPTIVDDMFDIIMRVCQDGAAVRLIEQNVLRPTS